MFGHDCCPPCADPGELRQVPGLALADHDIAVRAARIDHTGDAGQPVVFPQVDSIVVEAPLYVSMLLRANLLNTISSG
jgi:hypothetical protein